MHSTSTLQPRTTSKLSLSLAAVALSTLLLFAPHLRAQASDTPYQETTPTEAVTTDTQPLTPQDFLNALGGINTAGVSFYAQAIDSPEPLFELNSHTPRNPASLIKLVTTYAALQHFGADYRWNTPIYSQQPPNAQGEIHGGFLLRGTGDPQLVIEQIDTLVQTMHQNGVRSIQGDLLIDRSAFAINPEWGNDFDGEASLPYNALPDAALLNYRALSFEINPETEQTRMIPWLDGYTLNNQIRFTDAPCPATGWKSTVSLNVNAENATLRGNYPIACGKQQWHMHAYQTTANQYAQGLIAALFKGHTGNEDSICVSEQFWDNLFKRWHDCHQPRIDWQTPQTTALTTQDTAIRDQYTYLLAEVKSPPLANIVKDMNHYSNNVMARQIYLNLSATTDGATLNASATQTDHILDRNHIPHHSLNMGNGSGLSRTTRINAAELAQLLITAHPQTGFYDSLPRIGLEGTVRRRLQNTDMVGRGRIKTGTLSDTRAIAGYIDGKSGRRYAVVAIINDSAAQSNAGRRAHDLFMQWVGEQ